MMDVCLLSFALQIVLTWVCNMILQLIHKRLYGMQVFTQHMRKDLHKVFSSILIQWERKRLYVLMGLSNSHVSRELSSVIDVKEHVNRANV